MRIHMDANRRGPHDPSLSSGSSKYYSHNTFLRYLILTSFLHFPAMIKHKPAIYDLGATVPMDIVAREVPAASLQLRPAGDIEILGIATATCLLAFFLCSMLCTGLWMLRHAVFAVKIGRKRGEIPRPLIELPANPLTRPQVSWDGYQELSGTPYSTSSARISEMKTPWETLATMKHYACTQIPARRKPLSRKPLPMSNFMLNSNSWEHKPLNAERRWSLRSNEASLFEPKVKETRGYSDRSFLHYSDVSSMGMHVGSIRRE
ncbi:hypothetical protein F5Y07DRAFT_241724 [Xylaria sp. FL0933]|nr:hypothetical protein F5Y07DRAFT_241724 [Xylaria sp. FL0933]